MKDTGRVVITWQEVHRYEATIDRLDLAAVVAEGSGPLAGGFPVDTYATLARLTGEPRRHGQHFGDFMADLSGDNTRHQLIEVEDIRIQSIKPAP